MKAIILAGGMGRRLAPYTTILPKPLMPISDMPILEVIIRQLKRAGFKEVTLAVGHLSELLMAYFGKGEKWGIKICYSLEEQPLGTAGPLGLLSGFNEPFLVMNGDLLTTIDYQALWNYHQSCGTIATLAIFQRDIKIDLGVIEIDNHERVQGYIEKPTYHYTVSTGIYVFEPRILQYIPNYQRKDLPELVLELLAADEEVAAYPFDGIWLDIGRLDDYERAVAEFEQHRAEFLPDD
jgi:NDP-sugar pyrophosphorylase family protein